MKPTKELIWALRRAAVRILDPAEGYNWANADSCNCGLLVRELCGLSKAELEAARRLARFKCWGLHAPAQFCSTTGLPMDQIFDTLKGVGFEQEDFGMIEFCGEPFDEFSYTWCLSKPFADPVYVSAWFKQLADKLEQQLTGTVTTRDESPAQPDRPFATWQTTTNTQHITA